MTHVGIDVGQDDLSAFLDVAVGFGDPVHSLKIPVEGGVGGTASLFGIGLDRLTVYLIPTCDSQL